MAIDLKKVQEALIAKMATVDSNSPTKVLFDLYNTGNALGGNSNIDVYETVDDLPFLLDTTPDIQNLAFVKESSRIYTKTNQGWFASAKGKYQGDVAGYVSGKKASNPNTIAFSFASNTGSYHIRFSTVPSHGYTLYLQTGASSDTHGYIIGGRATTNPLSPSGPLIISSDQISRFPFSNTNSIQMQIGSLNVGAEDLMSATDFNNSKAYVFGGQIDPGGTVTNRIEKFSFSSTINSSDHGDMRDASSSGAGISSEDYGHIVGGQKNNPSPPPSFSNTSWIDRFPYASFTPTTSQINSNTWIHTVAISSAASETNGYFMSGRRINVAPSLWQNMYFFPFAAQTPVTVNTNGSQTESRYAMSGWSSTTYGYSASGAPPTGGNGLYTVDRWPYANNNIVVDVGDIGPSLSYTHSIPQASNHN